MITGVVRAILVVSAVMGLIAFWDVSTRSFCVPSRTQQTSVEGLRWTPDQPSSLIALPSLAPDIGGLRMPREARPWFHVCLVCTVWEDPRDPLFKVPEIKGLQSLAGQTFTNWTLMLVGDGLSSHAIGQLFKSLEKARIPLDQVMFKNMPIERRESRALSNLSREDLYKLGPVQAQRVAFRMIEGCSTCTHGAIWSYDDYYHTDHLETFYDNFKRFPAVAFMFSSISYERGDFVSPPPGGIPLAPNNFGPQHSQTPFPTWMWNLARLSFEIRTYAELKQSYGNRVEYADADAVVRIEVLKKRGIIQTMFIPKITCTYTVDKATLFEKIKSMT